jgi:hypothetical protein
LLLVAISSLGCSWLFATAGTRCSDDCRAYTNLTDQTACLDACSSSGAPQSADEASVPASAVCEPSAPDACATRCDDGDAAACVVVAEAIASEDPASAERLWDRACTQGHGSACATLRARRAARWKAACESTDPRECARAIREGRALCTDSNEASCKVALALPALAAAHHCESGSVATCEKACDAGVMHACAVLGNIHLAGVRVPMNVDKGMALVDRACEGGDTAACYGLGREYEPECLPRQSCIIIGGERKKNPDAARALHYHAIGCRLGDRRSCEAVVDLTDGGAATPSRDTLLVAFRALCRDGTKAACGRVRDLGEEP